MAALATRAFVAAGGDFYLCPLSENQLSRAERRALLQAVWEGTQALQPVWRPGPEGQPDEVVAAGFSVDVTLTATGGAHADAYLWIKRPGESDGTCDKGDPPAGTFVNQYAIDLAHSGG